MRHLPLLSRASFVLNINLAHENEHEEEDEKCQIRLLGISPDTSYGRGASMVASRATSNRDSSLNKGTANAKPSNMVRGRPTTTDG